MLSRDPPKSSTVALTRPVPRPRPRPRALVSPPGSVADGTICGGGWCNSLGGPRASPRPWSPHDATWSCWACLRAAAAAPSAPVGARQSTWTPGAPPTPRATSRRASRASSARRSSRRPTRRRGTWRVACMSSPASRARRCRTSSVRSRSGPTTRTRSSSTRTPTSASANHTPRARWRSKNADHVWPATPCSATVGSGCGHDRRSGKRPK